MSAPASRSGIVWRDARPGTVGALGPRARWGHTSVVVQARGGKERMLVLGKTGMSGHMLVFGYSAADNTWGLINCGGNVPPLRSRAAASVVGGRNVYVFGGMLCDASQAHLNEMWRLELATMTWHPVNTTGNTPAPRCYHSAVVWDKKIVYYGGETEGKRVLREVVVFDTETNTWLPRIPIGNTGPEERYSHTAVLWGDQMVVYGGRSRRNTYGDLWAFSLADMSTWTRLPDRSAPAARYGHSTVLMHGVMWVVGGWSKGTRERCLEVHAVDLGTGDASYGFRWVSPPTEGQAGAGRSRHTVEVMGDKLVMYGGEAGNGIVLGDTLLLDVSAFMPRKTLYTRWVHQCEFPEHSPATPDRAHTFRMVTVAQQLYVLHCAAGVWKVSTYDGFSRLWTTHEVHGDLPRCVRGFTLEGYAYGEGEHEHMLLVFGGEDEHGAKLNDLVQLDMATRMWSRVAYKGGSGPEPRSYHSMTLRGRELVVFGGGELPIEVLDIKTGAWGRHGGRGKSKWRWFKRNRDSSDGDAYWVPRKCEPDSVVWARGITHSEPDDPQLLLTNPNCHIYQWEPAECEWNRAVVSMCSSRSDAPVMLCEYDAHAQCHWVVQKDHSVHQIHSPAKSRVFVWDRASLGGGDSVLAHLSMHSAALLNASVYSLLTDTRGTMYLYKLVEESEDEWMSKEEGRLIAEGVLEPNTLGSESMHTTHTCSTVVGFGPDAPDEEDTPPGAAQAGLCCVCMTSAVGVVLIPCGHACLCPNCCHLIEKCPICRSPVQRKQRLFFV